MVRFGGNEFIGCFVPLAFGGRYFLLEPGSPDPLVSVVRDVGGEQLVFEILKNEPVENDATDVSKTPPGIVTVGEKVGGRFLYKVRPGSETSVVFGTLSGEEIEARINDRRIQVGGITVANSTFRNVGAGVVVDEDGSVAIGAPVPHALLPFLQS